MSKVYAKLRRAWVGRVLSNYYRATFIVGCRLYGVSITIGENVRFFHPVRVWATGGKIVIEDNVMFAFDGGTHWLGPIGIDMRSPDAELHFGRGCVIMRAARFVCFSRIALGEETTIGDGCSLLDSDVHDFSPGAWHKPTKAKPITLGQRVHLCPDVTILKGVSIGDDTIIGNKSVVQRSFPSQCVVAGNPARLFLRHTATESPVAVRKV